VQRKRLNGRDPGLGELDARRLDDGAQEPPRHIRAASCLPWLAPNTKSPGAEKLVRVLPLDERLDQRGG
jgi:hypothetical protein